MHEPLLLTCLSFILYIFNQTYVHFSLILLQITENISKCSTKFIQGLTYDSDKLYRQKSQCISHLKWTVQPFYRPPAHRFIYKDKNNNLKRDKNDDNDNVYDGFFTCYLLILLQNRSKNIKQIYMSVKIPNSQHLLVDVLILMTYISIMQRSRYWYYMFVYLLL